MTPSKSSQKKRFAVGAQVVVGMSGKVGTVLHVDDEPTGFMREYVHVVQTKRGELRVVGGSESRPKLSARKGNPDCFVTKLQSRGKASQQEVH